MLSFEEVKNFGKKEIKKKPSEREKLLGNVDPVKEALYLKWKETQPKTAGGTVNPIISTDWKVSENRNLEGKKSQTYGQALAANRAKASTLGANVPEVAKPSENIREMIFGTAKRGGTINPAISAADFSTRYDSMTDRENAIFSYYKKAGREKEAADYLKSIEMDMNQRAAEKRTADAKKLAEERAGIGVAVDVAGTMTAGAGSLYSLWQEAKGEAIDPYHPLFGGAIAQEGAHAGLIGESTGAAKFLKEAGLATAEWAGQALGFGMYAPISMAAGAEGTTSRDAAMRGATSEEAAMLGVMSGAAEMVAEKIGFDKWMKLSKLAAKGDKGKLAAEILKSMGSEGLEEGATEIANIISDVLIMGDKSQLAEIYHAAKAQGMSEGDAKGKAWQEAVKQVVYSSGLGAVSGGMIGGGLAGVGKLTGRNLLETAERQQETATQRAQAAQEKTAEESARAREKKSVETVNNTVDNGTNVPVEGRTIKTAAETAAEYGDKYFQEEGQKLFVAEAEKRGNVSFLPAFQTYYFAGNRGVLEKDIRQTAYTEGADRGLLTAAYMAGTKDRLADIEQRKANAGKAVQTVGVFGAVEKLTEGQRNYLEAISNVLGIEIQVEETANYNGKYANGRMHIAADAETFAGTVSHEMGHIIRQVAPESYAEIEQMVFTKLEKMDGKSFDQRLAEYDAKLNRFDGDNTEGRGGYDEYALMEEMVCDGLQAIVQSEADAADFFRSMEQQKPGILQKLKEFLENMLQKLQGLIGNEKYKEIAKDLRMDEAFVKELRDKVAKAAAEVGQTKIKEGVTARKVYKDSPHSTVTPSSKKNIAQQSGNNNNKNVTKFSLKEPVEETKDLIALHNLSAESFTEALKLGGFPMPSIAIVKDKMGHEKYGEISVVFGKDTIDPEADSRNAVFGGDGWTPTRPQVDYPVDYDRKREIEGELETLAKRVANGIFARASILSILGVDDSTQMNRRDIAEKLAGHDMVRAAYLAEQGKDIEPVYKKKEYDMRGNDFLQKIIDHYGEQKLAALAAKLELGEELDEKTISEIKEIWIEDEKKNIPIPKHIREAMEPEELEKKRREKAEKHAENKVKAYEAGKFILHAWEMYDDGGGVSEEIDVFATSDRLREETNHKEVADWAEGKLDGLLGEAGIYNGKEYYTASGNRRSFKQLHYPCCTGRVQQKLHQRSGGKEEGGEGRAFESIR